MPKLKDWLLPLLGILSNGFFCWLINQFPSKNDLHIPNSLIFSLMGVCIVALFILELSSKSQSSPASGKQNWLVGFLPLTGGGILYSLIKFQQVPAEFTSAVFYTSLSLFVVGIVLPPVLLLPRTWQRRLFWLPPAVFLWIGIHFLRQGQWISAFTFLVLEVVALLLPIIFRFIDKLRQQSKARLYPLVDQRMDSLAATVISKLEFLLWEVTSPFHRQYYQNLIFTYRTYRTQGLKTAGALTPDLDKVFVPLRVASKAPGQISAAMIQEQQSAANLRIWNFLTKISEQSAYKRIVVIGSPGSGKTTLLEHLTLTYAQHRQPPQAPKLIPVLFYLRQIRDEITSNQPPTLAQLVTTKLKDGQHEGSSLQPPPQWFKEKLRQGQCLVMLDGLDEVADETQRQGVSQWVDTQMEAYPKTTFILTSRPFGYRNAQLKQVGIVLEVQPFNLKQREEFLHSWYLQNEVKRQARQEDPGVRMAAAKKADDLIERLKKFPPLAAMACNPLLLTMIALVHDNRGALPGSRVELYGEICEVLLIRRQRDKDVPDTIQLNVGQQQSVLQVLALKLMVKKTREFTLAEGVRIIQHQLAAVAGTQVKPKQFLKHIENVSGLLVEKELGVYEFAHLSFQEYLAAAHVKETNQEKPLIQKINDSWWHETIRLYAAKSDATNLIRAALANPTVASLSIAYDCLAEGNRVELGVRQKLEAKLKSDVESSDPETFKLAAGVQLSRRLKNAVANS
ncbi:MAG: NACHT domain-containing protein [Symploca sp. SIO2C1]|nr:NACHT domain-containing protein [Symploca sp. SIO2C1]